MKRSSAGSTGRSRASQRRFTPQQTVLLVLASLLGLAWVVMGSLLVFSSRPVAQPVQPIPQTSPEASLQETPTWAIAPPTPALRGMFTCAQQGQNATMGTVTGVTEPGVLEVQIEGEAYPVSLAGIALPPTGNEQDRLNQMLRKLAEGQVVRLVKDTSEKDSAGRLVRYVFVNEQFLNDILIREGLALAAPEAPDQACAALFQQAEAQARSVRAGIWQPIQVPTSTFMPLVTLDPATQAVCDCSKQAECQDFTTQAEAQFCYNACNDYNSKLDLDRNGLACEELP